MGDFSFSGGVEVTGFISPTDTTDTYPVIDTLYGIDGLRNVNNLTQLNAIPNERRRSGMLVGVSGGTQYYKLNSSPWSGTTDDWSIFNTGGDISGGETTIKVSITAEELQNSYAPGGVPIDSGIAAPGVGKAILITALVSKFNWNSTQFNYPKGVLLIASHSVPPSTDFQWSTSNFLNGTQDSFTLGQRNSTGSANQIVENKGLNIWSQTLATQGDSTCDLYITYIKITI